MAQLQALSRSCEQTRRRIAAIYLHAVAVAHRHQHIAAIIRKGEVARMHARERIAHLGQKATLANAEYLDSILLEAVAGIEEATIIRKVYIGTSATTYAIRGYLLL